MSGQRHIVFLNIAAAGHMNPTLPLVAELVARGCKVTYFVDASKQDVVEAVGAEWRPFRFARHPELSSAPGHLDDFAISTLIPEGTAKEEYSGRRNITLYSAEQMLPALIEDLRDLNPAPAVLTYDPFLPAGLVAARVLGIPGIGMVTIPGPGVINVPPAITDALESKPWVERPRRAIADKYGLDVLQNGMIMECYSPVENIVTTIEELFSPPSTETQIRRFGHFPFTCVGLLMDDKVKRMNGITVTSPKGAEKLTKKSFIHSEISGPLPMQRIEAARQAGRKIIFISLGTVATSFYWVEPFGVHALANDVVSKEEGRRSLSEYTGKEFCQQVWRTCFDAFGDDDAFLVIMTLGPMEDAPEGLPPTPTNFLVRDAVPQIEVLHLCDAFLTHGGANGMREALSLGVPMAVVPIFGDQPANADTVTRSGAGVSFRNPLSIMSTTSLRTAVMELSALSAENPYRVAAHAMKRRLEGAGGGVPAAVGIILKHAACVGAYTPLPTQTLVSSGSPVSQTLRLPITPRPSAE